jgi:hypothetical protein
VVGVDDHADRVGRVRRSELESLAERRHDAAVRTEHRVQCLDREAYARRQRMRHEFAERLADVPAGAVQVAGPGRQAAADQHQGVGAEGGGLVDGGTVVVEPAVLVEEAAAAQRGDLEAGVAHQGGRLLQAVLGDLLAPQPDGRDAGLDAAGDQVLERPPLGGGLVEREAFHRSSSGISMRRPSREDCRPSSAICTPRAPAHRSPAYGASSAT